MSRWGMLGFLVTAGTTLAQSNAPLADRVLTRQEQEALKLEENSLFDYKGDRTSGNPEFVSLVTKMNIELTMDDIRERSPILKVDGRAGSD